MSYELEIVGGSVSLPADADQTGKQYFAFKLTSDGEAVICSTAGEEAYGILANPATVAGRACSIVRHGISKVKLGGTVAVGDKLATDANGKLVKGYGADRVVAIALESGVDGDIIAAEVVATAGGFAQHGPSTMQIPVNLATVADGDVVTTLTLPFAGRIKRLDFVVTNEVTTAAKATTLNAELGTTNLTGGAIALTSANCATLGAVVAGSAVTGANTFAADATLSIEASSTTAFSEGEGFIQITFA